MLDTSGILCYSKIRKLVKDSFCVNTNELLARIKKTDLGIGADGRRHGCRIPPAREKLRR